MADRPPIPSELRRIILTEASHHCAVCGYPGVDIHHIVPWSESRGHKAGDLVAICQNCHRRADRGDIDAVSLRAYKAALAHRRLYDPTPGGRAHGIDAPEARWVVHRIHEQDTYPRPFKVELEFPQFLPDAGDLATLNGIERAAALEALHEMRRLTLQGAPAEGESWSKMEMVEIQSFEVTLLTAELVSYRYETYSFTGGAHGNTATKTRTFRLNPIVSLGLEEAFVDLDQLTALLSKECIGSLEAESGAAQPDDWVRKGAGPDVMIFRRFNLTPWGLVITFDPYDVSCYAEGIRRVFIRKEDLLPMVRPESRVAAAWDGTAG